MPKKKYNLALVLSGGGARGMAHIGVLEILEKSNIVPNVIIGTSAGALVGGMYAAGVLDKFKKELIGKKKEIKKILRVWPSREGLIKTDKLERELKKLIGERKIEELDKKFIAVSVDLLTGKKVLIEEGTLCQAILASIAIPLVFPPLHREGTLLVDGGLEDPLPIDEGFRLARKVIAVDITRSIDKIPKKDKYNFVDILERALIIIQSEISEAALKKYRHNLVVLKPDVNINTLEFSRSKEAISIGEEETKKNLEKIKELLSR
ncbi:MAG: patatin-like phospholipase family protein [Candidatus Pacearchaeota archaeon]